MFWTGIIVALCIVLLAAALSGWIVGWRPSSRVILTLGLAAALALLLGSLLFLVEAPRIRYHRPVSLLSLDAPDEVRGGESCKAKLTVLHPDEVNTFAASAVEQAIMEAHPSVLEAHLTAPGFDIHGGEPASNQ